MTLRNDRWWGWERMEPRESYCATLAELSVQERDYLLTVRGLTPIWVAEDRPLDEALLRCPLSPDHHGPHLTLIGYFDWLFAKWIDNEASDGWLLLHSLYLAWGPHERAPRVFELRAHCEARTMDSEGREWSCGLMADHSGDCRFVNMYLKEGEYDDDDFDQSFEPLESDWRAIRNEEIVELYLSGFGTYREIAEVQGIGPSQVARIVHEMTTDEERTAAQTRTRENALRRANAERALIQSEQDRVAAARRCSD